VTVALFDPRVRWLLAAVAVLGMAVAAIARRRGAPRLVTIGLCATFGALGVLAAEAMVALTVRLAAPGSAQFNEHRWVLLAPWRRRGLWFGSIAVIAIAALSWRASRGATPLRRALLVWLRSAAALVALVVFLEPAIELRQVAREPNRVAIVVDDSRSMGLADHVGGPTRTARVRALFDASSEALTAWRRDHQLDVYSFSDVVSPASLDGVARTPPTGDATLIRKALETVRARYDGRDLAGVVLLSDGAATGDINDGDGAIRDFLRSLDTRVHTVWMARPGLKDVAVERVDADEFAFVRTVVRIEAVIRSTGYPARRVQVALAADGKVERQKWVELPAEGTATVSFEVTPPRVGRYLYEIAVPAADDEAVTANNSRAFVIRVIRDKIRVLQVAGAPSWDVRALRAMLEENPNVDLISFFILRTQDDISLVPDDEMSLIPFPTRELFEEQLPSFDVIVLQNFEFLPYGIGRLPRQHPQLRRGRRRPGDAGRRHVVLVGGLPRHAGRRGAAGRAGRSVGPGRADRHRHVRAGLDRGRQDPPGHRAALRGARQPRRVEGAARARGRQPGARRQARRHRAGGAPAAAHRPAASRCR
jgi:hypothetical protein